MSTSVERAMAVLELLAASDEALTPAVVAQRLEIPRSTAYKILRTLVDRDFVAVEDGNTYVVGLRAFEVGAAHIRRGNVVDTVAPQLTRVTQSLGVTSHYAILDGGDVVYLYKEDPPAAAIRLASSLGVRLPASVTAVGKSCLAWLPEKDISVFVEDYVNGGPGPSATELLEELTVVRERGFSTDEEDTASGIRCVAAPIFDFSGPRGAIGVSHMVTSSLEEERVATTIKDAADVVSAALGGKKA